MIYARKASLLAVAGSLLAFATSSHATPVPLLGGAADPYNMGFEPVPPNDPVPFSAFDIANLTDGNLATGYTFSSTSGQFSSNPDSTVGFSVNFDFDVSQYSSIDQIDFTWTGNFFWEDPNPSRIRFGYETAAVAGQLDFANDPQGLFTQTTSFVPGGGPSGWASLENVLHGDIARFFVSTDLGFSLGANIGRAQLDTFEISANVIGTLRDGTGGGGGGGGDGGGGDDGGNGSGGVEPVGVPEPGTLSLLCAGIGFLGLARRRSKTQA